MKTIKPQKLGLLHRTFEARGSHHLCVTLFVASPFGAPESPMHEAALWKMLSAELGKDVAPDLCMPKLRGEVLVSGRAYPLGGPRPACAVRLTLGPIDKTLWVAGDRTWSAAGVASDPVPFVAMPVTWDRAFGGPGYAANPAGKGFAPVKGERGETHPLPNVEDPKRLVRSRGDRPPPACFAPYDMTAPERYASTGTYDDAWLKNQFPGLPLDFDFSFFNTAPPDQRLDGYFRGDETFSVEHMHPERPVLEGRLPRFSARVFVSLRGGVLRDVPMRLDTVHLLPGAERMLLSYRGVTPVVEDDASDVLHLVAALEDPSAPKALDHYRAVLAERLDKKRGALASLRDGDLMPPGPGATVPLAEIADADLATPNEFLRRKNMQRKVERELDAARARIAAAGLDPDEHLPRPPPPPEPRAPALDEIEGILAKSKEDVAKAKADAGERRREAEAEARKRMADAGLDYDVHVAAEQRKQGGPFRFTAAGEIQRLRDLLVMARNGGVEIPAVEAQLADPAYRAKLEALERALADTYRKHAHRLPPAAPAEEALTERARIELPAGAQGGVSFAGRDLTGADLSGLDLRGVDLSSALLEGANLAGADLAGANLARAILARADLSGADLTGASLAGCNLGSAKLAGARIDGGVDLTRAVLAGADLTGASLRGARLDRADLGQAVFRDTDMSGATGANMTFLKSDLTGLKLAGASFKKGNFIEVDLRGVDFTGADLSSAAFLTVKADRAVFRGATLGKLRVVRESSLEGADFAGAFLERANLRGQKLAGCDFTRAALGGADLSECDLRGARFDGATAREARFTKADLSGATLAYADLMLAVLDRARLHGSSFLGANLFRADLLRVDVDGATSMKDANLKQIRFVGPGRLHGSS